MLALAAPECKLASVALRDGPRRPPSTVFTESDGVDSTAVEATALADAWTEITGDRKKDIAIFIHEVPGANVMEDGVILPDAKDDPGAIL